MKTNKQFIDEIYEKYNEYTDDKQKSKQRNMKKIINMAAVAIVLMSSLIVFADKKEHQIIQDNHIDYMTMQANINLQTIGSFENFYQIIKNKSEVNADVVLGLRESVVEQDIAKNESLGTDSTNSKTNTQVENVDESDVVKVDDKYIYYITEQKIVIIDAQIPEKADKITEINYQAEDFKPKEIYVKDNKLIVIGNETEVYCKTNTSLVENVTQYDVDVAPKYKTGVILYDISNIIEPKETRRVMIDGHYISSRMIENNLYFVANKYLNTSTIARNEMQDLNEDDYKPKYEDTAISIEEKCISYDRIYCLEETNDTSYLILVGLNIENDEEADIETLLGAGQYVYSSEKNMYIAINKQKYDEAYNLIEGTTHILKFGLENGKIIFKAEADIEGQVNNQFSMDESAGNFRIATTSGSLWNINENTNNNLYVLNSELEEVGKITGFAPEEKIYSVRYVEDKAFVVTFKQTDPLFVIDLSNPVIPQILGELKLPGYSTYLHPYDKTHIIGFGYETREDGTRVTTDGLKMVMFDVSDYTNPQVLFKVNIGNRYTISELLYNHKALLYSKEKNIIGFPLKSYERNGTNSRVAIYEIDLNQGFVSKGEISHFTNNYNREVERIVFVNNTYYTLSKKLVKVADMESLKVIKEIEL